jgi:hypothetical protein
MDPVRGRGLVDLSGSTVIFSFGTKIIALNLARQLIEEINNAHFIRGDLIWIGIKYFFLFFLGQEIRGGSITNLANSEQSTAG